MTVNDPTPHFRHAFFALTVLLALTISACGSGSGDTGNDSDALLPVAEGTTEYPLTLESPYGETVLSERPERIAVTNVTALDSLLALNVTPVFESHGIDTTDLPWRSADLLTDIETSQQSTSPTEPLNYEAVAASSPDLIVVTATPSARMTQEVYDHLSVIAPVLIGSPHGEKQGWDDALKLVGESLDLSARADQLASDLTSTLEKLPSQYPQLDGKTFAYAVISSEKYGVWVQGYENSPAADILEPFGLKVAPGSQEFSADNFKLSPENYSKLDADLIILAVQDATVDPSYFLDNEMTQNIPAIAEGRYVLFEPDPETGFEGFSWGLSRPTVLSMEWVITELMSRIDELDLTK